MEAIGAFFADPPPGTRAVVLDAVPPVLPRIAEADPRIGGLMESLMAAIAGGDKDAKAALRASLEGRAAKVTPP